MLKSGADSPLFPMGFTNENEWVDEEKGRADAAELEIQRLKKELEKALNVTDNSSASSFCFFSASYSIQQMLFPAVLCQHFS